MSDKRLDDEFLQLVDQSRSLLYHVGRIYFRIREDRDDFIQDTILNAWRAYPQFKKEARFSTWLYRIAINNALMHLRKAKRRITVDDLSKADEVSTGEHNDELLSRVNEVSSELNVAEQALLALYLEDLTYHEIGEALGISKNLVGVRINRLKRKMRKLI